MGTTLLKAIITEENKESFPTEFKSDPIPGMTFEARGATFKVRKTTYLNDDPECDVRVEAVRLDGGAGLGEFLDRGFF